MLGIHLFWWSLNNSDGRDNYGDMLAPFIVEKISGKKVIKVSHPMDRIYKWVIKHYVTVGSVINVVGRNSVVWGSGIIRRDQNVRKAKFIAVRGPRTRKRLLELGYDVPEVYGDPALLLPRLINNDVEKKYKIGVIPHYIDYEDISSKINFNEDIKLIDLMTDDVVKTTKDILSCEQIISSSLHGIVVSHAYQIPALWVKFSDKLSGDNVKFYDYLESLNINYSNEIEIHEKQLSFQYLKQVLEANQSKLLPEKEILEIRQNQLLKVCPFAKKI